MDRLLGAADPSVNVPLTSGGNMSAMSPYLNFDPSFLQHQAPEYILMEGVDKNKGVSHYCYQVGLPVLVGSAGGTVEGAFRGWQQAIRATGKERRALFLNSVRDRVKMRCQPLGAMATIFSLCQFGMSQVRDTQDELSYLTCGTMTGIIYKSTAGMKRAIRGGGIGLVISTAFCVLNAFYNKKSDLHYRLKNLLST